MNPLDAFLSRHIAAACEVISWNDMRLEMLTYLSNETPPLEWVTSVRAIVRREGSVLTVRDPKGVHILPGGRRKMGEGVEDTLAREILEETGWEIIGPRLLGSTHYHHLTAQPPDYKYPYPDFLQMIFIVEAHKYNIAGRDPNGYELSSEFVLFEEAVQLPIGPGQLALLRKAFS